MVQEILWQGILDVPEIKYCQHSIVFANIDIRTFSKISLTYQNEYLSKTTFIIILHGHDRWKA